MEPTSDERTLEPSTNEPTLITPSPTFLIITSSQTSKPTVTPPTLYPTHKPPTMYPTISPITPYPTQKVPTFYPTHKSPTIESDEEDDDIESTSNIASSKESSTESNAPSQSSTFFSDAINNTTLPSFKTDMDDECAEQNELSKDCGSCEPFMECPEGEEAYFSMYPDVAEIWPNTAFTHWYAFGRNEEREYKCNCRDSCCDGLICSVGGACISTGTNSPTLSQR